VFSDRRRRPPGVESPGSDRGGTSDALHDLSYRVEETGSLVTRAGGLDR